MDANPKSKGKILIIRTSALGDVAMTIPVVYSFARAFPEKEICVLTRPFFTRLFINAPANVRTIIADFKERHSGIRGMSRLMRELGRQGFDEVADFHDVVRSWAIDAYFRLKGKRVSKLNKDRKARKSLLSEKRVQRPYIDRYVDVLKSLGYDFELTFTSLFGKEKQPIPIEIKHPALGIAPFARYATKAYPLDLMDELIGDIEKKGIHVYIFGGKDDTGAIEQLTAFHTNSTNMAGKYPIEDELKIMSHMDLMLTMDSANQHLASLAGSRVVSMWGSTVPYGGFLAYRQKMKDAFYANLDCQPCSIAGCAKCPEHKDIECMRKLDRKLITAKISAILNERKALD